MNAADFNDDVDSTRRFSKDFLTEDSEGLSSDEHAAIDALPAGHALLIVRRGYEEGSRFLLDADLTTVGRHPNADILLDDVTVSRRHAEFVRTGSTFVVKDLASLNGTYYQGHRIDEAILEDGADVQIGKFQLTFYAAKTDKK
jgi:pSer/pThr/pTyr-binding forkhead associated (FHA) protein